ncbi:PREDICTED: uncharacterized mitochondrial protein AtMg00810-like [Prunus mume]|uniref:Uncharacterized mitochondrial protein AtMg00810-like n=1 Tax=Prunus mume TaxID=102107 RepID=A0ABM1LLC7_PRUMU|nr:PREDICTED: uncharacterized mitochondrial protein AtMg00810-like [Prunus mume]
MREKVSAGVERRDEDQVNASSLNAETQDPYVYMELQLRDSSNNLESSPYDNQVYNGISKRKAYYTLVQSVDLSHIEPSSFNAASTVPEWQFAMREEIEALHAQAFTQEFDMKDLGQLNYFLRLQISYQSTSLFVSQTKYIKELLDKVDLQDSKPCTTPCLPYHRLLKDDGKPYSHPTQYRSIVGALQYLTFTRLDIAFSVNQACQFMHNPMESHVVAVKRILRYLKGTTDFRIHFQPGPLNLQAYSDADWARDPNDQRFVSGFIVYLGSSPIS